MEEILSEIILEDGSVSHNPYNIMKERRNIFCQLFTTAGYWDGDSDMSSFRRKINLMEIGETVSPSEFRLEVFGDRVNDPISRPEMELLVKWGKAGKAMWIDKLLNQVLKHGQSIDVLS